MRKMLTLHKKENKKSQENNGGLYMILRRIEGLFDGIIAIAMILLVLDIKMTFQKLQWRPFFFI